MQPWILEQLAQIRMRELEKEMERIRLAEKSREVRPESAPWRAWLFELGRVLTAWGAALQLKYGGPAALKSES